MIWKTLFGHCIYQSAGGLKVFQNPLFRWLTFDSDALQTVLNRKYPQKPALTYIKPLILPVKIMPSSDCCMLGLGGGGVAHTLATLLGNATLTIIENSAEVIEIAARFFGVGELKNIHLVHQDAYHFVQQCQTPFQHLLVDLFNAEVFPSHCATKEFFYYCKRLLKPQGIFAINIAHTQEHWPIFQLISAQFGSSTVVIPAKSSSNLIVVACENKSLHFLLTMLKQKEKIKRLIWDSQWGCMAEIDF